MKVLLVLRRALWEIFDFFCGDWYNLVGLAVTVVLIAVINRVDALAWARPAGFVLYPLLIALTLTVAIRRAVKSPR